MLVYTKVVGESAPQAFLLSGPDAMVGELLERVGTSRIARGRKVSLDGNPEDNQRLIDVGVNSGDLVSVYVTGESLLELSSEITTDLLNETFDAMAPVVHHRVRISEYEEMTRLLQWQAPYHINADRPSHEVWSDESTALRCSDWDAFRSPDKLYYRTYISTQAKSERAVQTVFEFAQESGQMSQVGDDHVALMKSLIGGLQYPEWGLCMVHQHATRFAMSSWIAGATEFMMFDELRHAQLYGRVALAYSESHEGFDEGQSQWMEDDRFQPTRRLIEELLVILDWGKAMLIAGILVEPVLTSVVHALLTSGSLRAGDSLTPFVCQTIDVDKRRHRASVEAFLELVCQDATFGAENRDQISKWFADWLPRVEAAAMALAGNQVDGQFAVATAVTEVGEWLQKMALDPESSSTGAVGVGTV